MSDTASERSLHRRLRESKDAHTALQNLYTRSVGDRMKADQRVVFLLEVIRLMHEYTVTDKVKLGVHGSHVFDDQIVSILNGRFDYNKPFRLVKP